MIDQTDFLRADEVVQGELLLVLLEHFGTAAAPTPSQVRFYRQAAQDAYVEVLFNRNGRIRTD